MTDDAVVLPSSVKIMAGGTRGPAPRAMAVILKREGGTFQTIWVTLLHELTPSETLGRVASIDLLGSFCLQPLGFLFAGVVADALGPAYVFLGAGVFNLALYAFPLFLPGIQRVD